MNEPKRMFLGIILMILGISGIIISGTKMQSDPYWVISCFTSVVTAIDGIIMLDNIKN